TRLQDHPNLYFMRYLCCSTILALIFFSGSGDHRDLHSFPTRRSSDLFERANPAPPPGTEPGRPSPRMPAEVMAQAGGAAGAAPVDRKSTRLNSSHVAISYAVFCLKKKNSGVQDVTCPHIARLTTSATL